MDAKVLLFFNTKMVNCTPYNIYINNYY